MRGLLRLSFYGARESAMLLLGAFAVFGAVTIAVSNTFLTLSFGVLCISAFSFNAIASARKEAAANWGRYAITTPVRRRDIVQSRYAHHLLWVSIGAVFVAVFVGLSYLVHGHLPLDNGGRDLLLIFSVGIGVPLLIGSIYYPTTFRTGADKSEMVLIISLVGAVGFSAGIMLALNFFYGFKPIDDAQYLLGMLAYLGIVVASFIASYFLAERLHQKKEFYA